jgi:RNA polymerase sigma factor for flagellar operon FliA
MADALGELPEHDTRILFLYYEQNRTLREIAAELGISVSSATQAHTRLVDRVRGRLSERHGQVA